MVTTRRPQLGPRSRLVRNQPTGSNMRRSGSPTRCASPGFVAIRQRPPLDQGRRQLKVDPKTGIEVLEPEECLRLLRSEEVGRLAVVVGGFPAIFPVNYVVDGDRVVFRTDAGTKLDGATRGGSVVFEVDHLDPNTRSGWSVILNGRADEITKFDSPAVRERASRLALYPWSAHDKAHLVCISANSVTGRRVRGT